MLLFTVYIEEFILFLRTSHYPKPIMPRSKISSSTFV